VGQTAAGNASFVLFNCGVNAVAPVNPYATKKKWANEACHLSCITPCMLHHHCQHIFNRMDLDGTRLLGEKLNSDSGHLRGEVEPLEVEGGSRRIRCDSKGKFSLLGVCVIACSEYIKSSLDFGVLTWKIRHEGPKDSCVPPNVGSRFAQELF
jgi:hypothetical protein